MAAYSIPSRCSSWGFLVREWYRTLMSKPRARLAISIPILPMPTMPRVDSLTSAPSQYFG